MGDDLLSWTIDEPGEESGERHHKEGPVKVPVWIELESTMVTT